MRKAIIIVACILYVLSPIDLIPDPILVVGWMDDLAAIGFAIKKVLENPTPKRAVQSFGSPEHP